MTASARAPAPAYGFAQPLHEVHQGVDFALVRLSRPRGLLYARGFGEHLDERLAAVGAFQPSGAPAALEWGPVRSVWGSQVRVGRFRSPAAGYLPAESHDALVELWAPDASVVRAHARPRTCVIFTSTAEEGPHRRRPFARFLAARGIAAVILENPYYGARRPRGQRGGLLRTVADQFAMNLATVEEACALLLAFRRQGHDVGVTGYSQGGVMAAFAAALCDFPVAAVPRGAPVAPAAVFTQHALSGSVHWEALARQAGSLDAAKRTLMDAFERVRVDLRPPPRAPGRAIIVGHRSDAFIPPSEVERLHRHWRGAELRWLDGGHVTGLALHHRTHWETVVEAFDRA